MAPLLKTLDETTIIEALPAIELLLALFVFEALFELEPVVIEPLFAALLFEALFCEAVFELLFMLLLAAEPLLLAVLPVLLLMELAALAFCATAITSH